ncbi:MAG: ABC transporter permease, partial [Geminicoccaceae bacterium]
MTALVASALGGRESRPILIACACIVVILIVGTIYTLWTQGTASFLSPRYLMQQLQVGAFLGLVAAGMMLVILLGHIDLSVPWTIAAAAMMATAVGGPWALPVGLGLGVAVGLVNGLGVAYLRVPSMIFTLGVNAVLRGLMVMHTGGFAPQTHSTPLMEFLAVGHILGIPMALFVWILVSILIVVILRKTPLGRYIYAVGNREAAAYLSGVNTRLVLISAFVLCSTLAALAGVLLAGYSTKAYQGMGDAYLLPSIAAVVIGGT